MVRFDPVNIDLMIVCSHLLPSQQIQALLDTRELAVSLIRGRLREQYPDLTPSEINLRLLANWIVSLNPFP